MLEREIIINERDDAQDFAYFLPWVHKKIIKLNTGQMVSLKQDETSTGIRRITITPRKTNNPNYSEDDYYGITQPYDSNFKAVGTLPAGKTWEGGNASLMHSEDKIQFNQDNDKITLTGPVGDTVIIPNEEYVYRCTDSSETKKLRPDDFLKIEAKLTFKEELILKEALFNF